MLASWVPVPADSHFPLNNLPYGVFSTAASPVPRLGVAIGDSVLDLAAAQRAGLLSGPVLSAAGDCFQQPTLNAFMALGRPAWAEARATLLRLLSAGEGTLRDDAALRSRLLLPASEVRMHLPAAIGDYTDFYASREHATNIGIMFRGRENALQPNWLHLPVGYHGRASSVVVSGTDVRRPRGQVVRGAGQLQAPAFEPSAALDFELEVGCFIGPGNELGCPIPVERTAEHIFGYVLVNDWSARDIQRWEYVPLGPFTSKNFATSISPWIVTPDALEPFACAAPPQDDPQPLAYLRQQPAARTNYDIQLEVAIQPGSSSGGSGGGSANFECSGSGGAGRSSGGQPTVVTRSNLRTMYWTLPQMIAHHTAGGCNLRPGDLLASGTLSCEGPLGAGCLQEATWGGSKPVRLDDNSERTFLLDGDTVVMSGHCQGQGYRVGFGECRGTVRPAADL